MNPPTTNFAQPDNAYALLGGHQSTMPRLGLGLQLVLCVPLAAGMGSARGVTIGGFNYTGWMWVFFLVFSVLSILAVKALDRDCRIAFPYRPWLLWFGLVGVSLVWCENLGVRNVQDLIQISMPLIIGIAASLFVATEAQLKLLLRMFGVTLFIICFALIGTPLGLFGGLDMAEGIRPMGFTAVLVGCVFLAGCPARLMRPLLMWGACVLVCTATGGRMATVVLLLLPILHPLLKGWRWRVIAVVAMAGLSLALFYTPLFQERFFYTGSGTLAELFQGQVRGSGRFEAWPVVLQEAWTQPILGHGVGTTYDYVPTVWYGMHHIQNDYLRIGYELGLVGLAIFLGTMTWQIVALWKRMNRSQGISREAAAAALLGLFAFLIASWTANTLVYNLWYMSPLFAVIGGVYGVSSHSNDNQPRPLKSP